MVKHRMTKFQFWKTWENIRKTLENTRNHWENTQKCRKTWETRVIFEKQWENMGKHRKNPKKEEKYEYFCQKQNDKI